MQQAARHLDRKLGLSQEATFLGEPGARMFTTLLSPLGRVDGGVVVCSPTHAELPKNYRREVLLARALVHRGVAVLRFHYRGSGHSDGTAADLTCATMVADTRLAIEHLAQVTDGAPLGLLGTRLGALVAAAASPLPLALWEPILDPSTFLREVFRARRMSALQAGSDPGTSVDDLLARLHGGQTVDVLGYSIDPPLAQSFEGRHLTTELLARPRPVLLVQFGGEALGGAHADAAARWRERGLPVAAAAAGSEEAWWFANEIWRPDEVSGADHLLATTADWLAAAVAAVPVSP